MREYGGRGGDDIKDLRSDNSKHRMARHTYGESAHFPARSVDNSAALLVPRRSAETLFKRSENKATKSAIMSENKMVANRRSPSSAPTVSLSK